MNNDRKFSYRLAYGNNNRHRNLNCSFLNDNKVSKLTINTRLQYIEKENS